MPYSDYNYVVCVPSQEIEDFLYAIRMCLEHLGGVLYLSYQYLLLVKFVIFLVHNKITQVYDGASYKLRQPDGV